MEDNKINDLKFKERVYNHVNIIRDTHNDRNFNMNDQQISTKYTKKYIYNTYKFKNFYRTTILL